MLLDLLDRKVWLVNPELRDPRGHLVLKERKVKRVPLDQRVKRVRVVLPDHPESEAQLVRKDPRELLEHKDSPATQENQV